jgi:uncharacterized membrane protein
MAQGNRADPRMSGTQARTSRTSPTALEPEPAPARGFTLDRIVFFSDAVFAIAITLLALNVRLPDGRVLSSDAALVGALRDLAPQLFAFVISFVVIAAFWLGHYRAFRVLVGANTRLVWLNFAFLLFVALLPFPTSVVAGHADLIAAAVLYAGFVAVTGVLSAVVWIYAAQVARLARPTVTPDLARHVTLRALTVPALFGLSIPLAFLNPRLAEISWVLVAPVELLVSRRFGLRTALDPPVVRAAGEAAKPTTT